jgi:hypothetical protein
MKTFVVIGEINQTKSARFLSPDLPDLYAQLGSPDTRKDDLEISFSAEVVPKDLTTKYFADDEIVCLRDLICQSQVISSTCSMARTEGIVPTVPSES